MLLLLRNYPALSCFSLFLLIKTFAIAEQAPMACKSWIYYCEVHCDSYEKCQTVNQCLSNQTKLTASVLCLQQEGCSCFKKDNIISSIYTTEKPTVSNENRGKSDCQIILKTISRQWETIQKCRNSSWRRTMCQDS